VTLTLHIRLLEAQDIPQIAAAFAALGWNKPAAQYERYLAEQETGQRPVLVAFVDAVFAGYVTVQWLSDYPPFQEANIPEIVDFNVLPHVRRRGIGSRLMDAAEQTVAQRSSVVGIRVGLYADYGSAQRMYVKRGYIPDGRGLFSHGHWVKGGESVMADDDLMLCFTKDLMDNRNKRRRICV
jgi:GNAT superfamily N-acetyltransferase